MAGEHPHTAALILAAGASRRFGGIKLLAPLQGRPLLAHCLALAEKVLPGQVHVVLGAHGPALRHWCAAASQSPTVIDNPLWQSGMASSIAAGVSALDEHYEHLLLLLADQPAIPTAALVALLDKHHNDSPDGVTCAYYDGVRGIPAVFSRRWFSALKALTGDQGARQLLRDERIAVATVAMPGAAYDIDRPADLSHFEQGV